MKITFKKTPIYELVFEAENVKVTEHIGDIEFFRKENGNLDFGKPPNIDIKTVVLNRFTSVFGDMLRCRKAKYDSSALIEKLFNKLPKEVAINLLAKLNKSHGC